MGHLQVLPIQVWVNLGVIAKKGNSTHPRIIEPLDSVLCHSQDTDFLERFLSFWSEYCQHEALTLARIEWKRDKDYQILLMSANLL